MNPDEKFIDFKAITFFRVMILVLALLMFLAPWTISIERPGGLGGIGVWVPSKVHQSGFNYLLGCEPFVNSDVQSQVSVVFFNPVLLLISLMMVFKPRKEFITGSIAFSLASLIPIYHWIGKMQALSNLTFDEFHISYGIYLIYLLIAVSIFLGILTWLFCDLDESKLLDSASDS